MIAPTSFFADYGNHIRIWQEARALQSIGHRVVIATYHNGDDMPGLEIHRSWDVPWIRRVLRVPLIFDYQGSLTSEMIDHHFLSGTDSRLYRPLRRLEHWIDYQADALITSSHNAAAMLGESGFPADRLYTVIDGIDIERFRPFDGNPSWEAE